MKDKELISVITPMYNSEKYIGKTIQSVLNQTYKNLELIIIDDKSTDDSISIVKQFNDPRIKLIQLSENAGVAAARNRGIDEALGKYIAFVDADDVWESNKLELQMNCLKDSEADFCYTGYRIIDATGNIVKNRVSIPSMTNYSKLLSTNVIACSTVLLKKEKLSSLRFRKIKHEDYVLWLELAKSNLKMLGIDQPLMNYRKHTSSISSNKLKSATWVWNIYRNVEHLNLVSSCYHFIQYAFNGVLKHFF